MSLNFIRNIIFIIVLLLVQTLLLNHISVFGCATPLLYVYFALTIQRGESKWATLLWCFAMGLPVDIFSNTPGVAAAAMTLVGFLQPYVIELFAPRDSAEDLRPVTIHIRLKQIRQLHHHPRGYLLLSVLLARSIQLLQLGSMALKHRRRALLTIILILVIENFRSKR